MLTTANPEWDRQFRLWRQHSMSASDTTRHASRRVLAEEYTELGYNYRLTDLQAAIGRAQLERLPGLVAQRRAIADRYHEWLGAIPDLQLPCEPAWARSNWQSYCVRLPFGVNQLHVMQSMLDDGIATRRGVMCAHREPAFRREPWRAVAIDDPLSISEAISSDGLMLPLYADLTETDQRRVVDSLARCHPGGGQSAMSLDTELPAPGEAPSPISDDAIRETVLGAMRSANLGRSASAQLVVSADAPFFGPASPLDSLGWSRCCSTSKRRCRALAARSC